MCKENTRDRRNCSGIVSYPMIQGQILLQTLEHNINGPPEMEKPTKPCPNGQGTTKMGAKRACKSIGGSGMAASGTKPRAGKVDVVKRGNHRKKANQSRKAASGK